jgi:hypothetical protein
VTAADQWHHLPEPLRALLRELRAKAAARVRARLDEMNRAFLERLWGAPIREKGKGVP